MNLILLAPEQALSDQQYKLSDRQIEHIAKVLKKDCLALICSSEP